MNKYDNLDKMSNFHKKELSKWKLKEIKALTL